MTLPDYFTQTSDKPYARHHYIIICTDQSTKVMESWHEVQETWWNKRMFIDRIEVIDKPKKRGKGF